LRRWARRERRWWRKADGEPVLRVLLRGGPASTKQVEANAAGSVCLPRTIESIKLDFRIEAAMAGMKASGSGFAEDRQECRRKPRKYYGGFGERGDFRGPATS
jgi:hypothetical protein